MKASAVSWFEEQDGAVGVALHEDTLEDVSGDRLHTSAILLFGTISCVHRTEGTFRVVGTIFAVTDIDVVIEPFLTT